MSENRRRSLLGRHRELATTFDLPGFPNKTDIHLPIAQDTTDHSTNTQRMELCNIGAPTVRMYSNIIIMGQAANVNSRRRLDASERVYIE